MEFLLLIRGDYKELCKLSPNEMQIGMEKGIQYIRELEFKGILSGKQVLEHSGILLRKNEDIFNETKLDKFSLDIFSYLNIKVDNWDEAIVIAKSDPRFEQAGWKIEVRQILE